MKPREIWTLIRSAMNLHGGVRVRHMSYFTPCQHGGQGDRGDRQGEMFKAVSVTSFAFASPSPVWECMHSMGMPLPVPLSTVLRSGQCKAVKNPDNLVSRDQLTMFW